jgi:hypothetical protein
MVCDVLVKKKSKTGAFDFFDCDCKLIPERFQDSTMKTYVRAFNWYAK